MKCVVTGGAGFIGSRMVSAIRQAGSMAVDISGGEGIHRIDI